MSSFSVPIVVIRNIEPIDGADAIEVAVVGGYKSVVQKGQYKTGDLVAYIPEDAVVPEELLAKMGLSGKLAGPNKNRVKAIRLRGTLSQGLILGLDDANLGKPEGTDLADYYGIAKYTHPIPTSMGGEVFSAGRHLTIRFDVENIKKYPDAFVPGEPVYVTEKLHGTFCGVGIVPENDGTPDMIDGRFVVFSKGIASNGLAFCDTPKNREGNVYIRTLLDMDVFGKLDRFYKKMSPTGQNGEPIPMFLLGEVFGVGIQDLGYGQSVPMFRLFSIVSGYGDNPTYEDAYVLENMADELNIPTVPYLAANVGFSYELVQTLSTGLTDLGAKNIREGVVIVPAHERYDSQIGGRLALKSISEQYLMRKNKDATEYQ